MSYVQEYVRITKMLWWNYKYIIQCRIYVQNIVVKAVPMSIQNYKYHFQVYLFKTFSHFISLICWISPQTSKEGFTVNCYLRWSTGIWCHWAWHSYQNFEHAALVTTGFSKVSCIFNNLNCARNHDFNIHLKSQV